MTRSRSKRTLAHFVLGVLGAGLSYLVVGQAWVRFDTIVVMWLAVAACLGLAVLGLFFRWARGGAIGLAASALVFGCVYTVVSLGPALP